MLTAKQLAYLHSRPSQERASIMAYYETNSKKTATAVLLCLFLGGFGIHHFYLGRTLVGVLSVVFFWTFIPALIAFFELFFLSSVVRQHNLEVFRYAAQMFEEGTE